MGSGPAHGYPGTARLSPYGRTLSAPRTAAVYGTEGIRPLVPVLIDQETGPFQRTVPSRIHQHPLVVDTDTAGQVVGNGKTGCQLSEFWRVLEVWVIPEKREGGIDYLKTQSPAYLRQEVMLGHALPFPKREDLLRGCFWIGHGDRKRVWDIADMLE